MYDSDLCDLCQERAKVPGAIVIAGDERYLTCLECRRIEILTDGIFPPSYIDEETSIPVYDDPQAAFEALMKPMGRKCCKVVKSFA